MSKKVIFSVIGVLLVIFLVVLFSGTNKKEVTLNNEGSTSSKDEAVKTEKTFPLSGDSTIQNLVMQNKSFECAITYNETEVDGSTGSTEGNIFTNEGRLRGDFIIETETDPIVYSMVIKDQTMFSWSEIDGEKYGVKVNLENKKEDVGSKEPVSLEDKVSYDCKVWDNIDNSVFETPNDIVFTDFDDILKKGMEYGNIYEDESVKGNSCSVCEKISDKESKNQCLQDFSCSNS